MSGGGEEYAYEDVANKERPFKTVPTQSTGRFRLSGKKEIVLVLQSSNACFSSFEGIYATTLLRNSRVECILGGLAFPSRAPEGGEQSLGELGGDVVDGQGKSAGAGGVCEASCVFGGEGWVGVLGVGEYVTCRSCLGIYGWSVRCDRRRP